MSNIWKPRPPSFPSDDKIPFTAAEVNEFDDIQDLNIRTDNQRHQSEEDIDLDAIQRSKLFRARDSVFVRQKQRNSIVSTFDGSEDESNFDSGSARNVRFHTINLDSNEGIDNEVFQNENEEQPEEEEVVLRRKTVNSQNIPKNDFNFESYKKEMGIDEETKAWDVFKTIPPPDEDETLDGEWVDFFIKSLKIIAYIITFCVILVCAVISKSFILLMTSMIRVNQTIAVCNQNKDFDVSPPLDLDKHYDAIYREGDPERIVWIWCLFFAVIAPEIFAFGRSFRICFFKKYKIPKLFTFLTVSFFETFHSIGLSLLVFLILPTIDSIKGSMITNSMCLIPGILLLLKKNKSNKVKHLDPKIVNSKEKSNKILTIVAIVCQLSALIIWPIIAYHDESKKFWCLPISLIMISMCWWENFINQSSNNSFVKTLIDTKKDLAESRYFTFAIISIWKVIVVFLSMSSIIYFNDGSDAIKTTFLNFTESFSSDTIEITRNFDHVQQSGPNKEISYFMKINDPLIPVWILLIQISATYLCYAFAKFTCKIHIQTISFAIPVHLVVPVTISFIWVMVELSVEDKCRLTDFFNGFQYIFWFTNKTSVFEYYSKDDYFNYVLAVIWILSLASQILITVHIWTATSSRLASTEELFINPMYNSVLIDQSLALNRRRFNLREEQIKEDEENGKKSDEEVSGTSGDNYYESVNDLSPKPLSIRSQEEEDDTVRIFVCATMWHENKEEMIQMLKAVMRLDEDQFNRKMAQQFFDVPPAITDYYEIEFNIYFDDAFEQGDPKILDDRKINRFVKTLIETMDEAASHVHGTIVKLITPNLVPTPYGGKLEWTLPGQNKLVAHLKDKIYIRHRKRWSQCMYMYYLLGHRIAELPIDDFRKERRAMNTYILALDGDINFRPQALHLVVDLMKKNKRLGAACGRIHPIGTGPMVWYQKFEYAIGHWLQKATEHVFGCVLCSPGCFSLFRARAVMDDSVMNKYTTPPSEALHYVQYDQGEDRWLCTLLLQQGWRIEYCAASDSYTHAPEGFGEFYTQRRRWAPSTMANIMDLLGEYKRTVERNTDISKPYILYQAMLMLGTVLSPGTIFLMVVGAMNTVMNLDTKYSLAINIVPILLFSIICLLAKNNDHIIFVAMILSTIYALLMLAVLVGTAIDIKDQGPLTPNSIFFMGMMSSFILAAILHPQEFACVIPLLLYMLLIPSMYLLLTIYSVTNMHVVTWGTREVKSTLTAKEMEEQAEAAKEAEEAKKNKKSRFGFLNLSHYGSKSGIFTCMCCSNSKADEDSSNLLEIKDKLNRVFDNIDNIKSSFDQKANRRASIYRRKSFQNRDPNAIHLSVTEEEEEDDDSISETTSLLHDNQKPRLSIEDGIENSDRPKWARDPTFKGFPLVQLTENELLFWENFIPKYLLPLDENAKEKKRISDDLKDLRNKAVFAFGIINVIFVLFVYLLQMHKDVFGIKIVSGRKFNGTFYNEKLDKDEDQYIYTHTVMDPIGLVLVVFFGAILIVQLIGMFMHRFGTLAHLLAFTSIDFFDSKPKLSGNQLSDIDVNRNAVRITRQIQKQGVKDMNETENISPNPMNRRQSVFQRPQTAAQPLDLNQVFRQRIMSMKPDEAMNIQGMRRKSINQAVIDRRKTMDWGRTSNAGDGILRLNSQQSNTSRTPSVSSFNPRPKSITFQMPNLSEEPQRSPNQSVRTLVNPMGSQPKVLLTPETPINEGPPTGQHSILYFNRNQQNMANDMSSQIIRNSLNELKKIDENEDQVNNDYQLPQTSSSADPNRQKTDKRHSTESTSNSTVSSNIDFNFDYVESDSSNEFPLKLLQPTTIQINNSSAQETEGAPKQRISYSEDSEESSTRL